MIFTHHATPNHNPHVHSRPHPRTSIPYLDPPISDDDLSPFAKYTDGIDGTLSQAGSPTFAIFVEPVLFTNTVSNSSTNDSYRNIITLSSYPAGPLSNMVVKTHVPRLSEYSGYGGAYGMSRTGGRCIYAITRYPKYTSSPPAIANTKNTRFYMTAEEIPAVLGYMKDNGYLIDTDITRTINDSGLGFGTYTAGQDWMGGNGGGKKRFICMATAFTSTPTLF
jgi:hypothetical protein